MKRRRETKAVLVVDDDAAWYGRFRDFFALSSRRQECPYIFEVDTASSIADARSRILRRWYDVIIFDVRMEEELSGIEAVSAMGVLEHVGDPSPVMIVFTGFPIYESCVKAMRHGAWDYVEKKDVGKRFAAQVVVESAIDRLRELELQSHLDREMALKWLPWELCRLQEEYPNKLVAIWHEPRPAVIASGNNVFELEESLKEWREHRPAWAQPFIVKIPAESGSKGRRFRPCMSRVPREN